MKNNHILRTTFNTAAELYDVIRPRYPEVLFESLIKIASLQQDDRLLEIGPGTGQATEPFARRGYRVTAVELGTDLADIARQKLNRYENADIITGTFENTEFPCESFNLIYSATAFHWIDEEVKFTKTHRLLKSGGYLAIIRTHHVSDESGDDFFFASQPIYKKYTPEEEFDESFRLKKSKELQAAEVDENYFKPVGFYSFPLKIKYSAQEYVQLLNTYSPTLSLEHNQREGFLNDIEELIETRFGGFIEKNYVMTVTIAKKK